MDLNQYILAHLIAVNGYAVKPEAWWEALLFWRKPEYRRALQALRKKREIVGIST